MRKISVVIPYFQKDAGVLSRALRSVDEQIMPDGWQLEVVIVDDGSPVPAKDELRRCGLDTAGIYRIINQDNAGVGAARNRGLDAVTQRSELVAFLDSDDIWAPQHLARAIEAHEAGYDFYFADNRREGLHDSQVSLCYATASYVAQCPKENGLVDLSVERMVGFAITEFPCQASTVVFRAAIAPKLRFHASLRSSGEDVLYFSELVSRSRRVCYDTDCPIECGDGVNIYFGNLDWNSPRFLAIEVDRMLTYRILERVPFLSEENRALNRKQLRAQILVLGLHFPRLLLMRPRTVSQQLWRLIHHDAGAAIRVVRAAPGAVLAWLVGKVAPSHGHAS